MPTKKAQRADKRYEVSITLGRDAEGKRVRKSFYGRTQKEAKDKRDKFLKGQKLARDASQMSIDRWRKIWVESYATGGYRNKLNKASNIKRFSDFMGGHIILYTIKQADVQAYAKTQAKFTKSHVYKVRRDLGNFFEAALDNEFVTKSPCEGVNWEYEKTGSHDMLEPYLVDLITKNWKIHPAGTWAMLMLYAGLRPSEAFALSRENITDDFISVTDGSHFEHGRLVVVQGQAKSEAGQRDIPIMPPLREVIQALPESGLVCLSTKGLPVSEAASRANWKAFWNMLEEIHNGSVVHGPGRRSDRFPEDWQYLPKVQMYDLRHTFCSFLYDADVDVKTAQYLMGHASLEITLKIYTHLSEKKKTRSYDKLIKYFSPESDSQTDSQESPEAL
jgi:integrase